MSAGTKLIDIKEELESLMPVLQGSTQGEAVAFCIRILGERWEVEQQRDRLAEALREFISLDDNPPLSRHGKRWAETWRKARAALAEVEGKEGV